VELGVYTFAELSPSITPEQRMRNLVEEARVADEVGLDVFGVGEHHRPDFAVSAPSTALAACAEATERIRLTSAVSVLSSDDPIRVFQQFATLDLLSGGRAEIMAGRGSFIESFPLFGLDLDDYDELFSTKLERLLELREAPAAHDVYPPSLQQPLPVWLAVGGNPPSVIRAAEHRLPLALAIIGGQPERFVPLVDLYREALGEPGRVSINSHAYVAEDSRRAGDEYFPGYARVMTRVGRERGWPPMERPQFEALREPRGSLLVGNPEQVAEKILFEHELFGHSRFLAQIAFGDLPHDRALRAIELLGTEVAPLVRGELSRRAA
jgi:probable LLM family oxidoreductase